MGYWWQQLRKHPTRLLVGGFAAAILLGGIVLTLPISASGARVTFVDALFTATSAVCVTGLNVRDPGSEYSLFGQVAILILIQLGGLGITTLSTALFLFFGQRASLSSRDVVESSFRARPEGKLAPLVAQIFVWTITIELIGATLLLPTEWQRHSPGRACWNATFHAVSAFCNAGFSLRSDSLMSDRANPAVILPLSTLIILGGIGFSVLTELRDLAVAKLRRRKPKRLSLHARTAVVATACLLLMSTLAFWSFERGNLLRGASPLDQLLASFFAAVTPRTAGFNSINYAQATTASIYLTIALMAVGGCPGSTAGGVKATTVAVLYAMALSRIRGNRWVRLFGRGVPDMATDKSLAVVALMTLAIVIGVLVLSSVELQHKAHVESPGRSVGLLFEVVSALGTAGLSTGVTPTLSTAGRLVVIVLMFVGRLGPLTIAVAIARQEPRPAVRMAEEPIMIG